MAVVGAGARPGVVGHALFANIVQAGFTGAAYPVYRRDEAVAGRPGFASLADLPGPVKLAVGAVGSRTRSLVPVAARQGARWLVVISAGFAEAGPAGAPCCAAYSRPPAARACE